MQTLVGDVETYTINKGGHSLILKEENNISHAPVVPVAQRYPCNILTHWDVSLIPANEIFLPKKKKKKKMSNGWRTIKSLVHEIQFHGRDVSM